MAWTHGEPWRVVESLQILNAQIRDKYPEAVNNTPASSWGSIADNVHSSTSDHFPHYYSALGAVYVVCARDFPHVPKYGLNAHAIAEQLRLSRDSRISYVISNGRITGPGHDWKWDTYHGTDPHDTHIHVSTVHDKRADDRRQWRISPPVEDDMYDQDAENVAWATTNRAAGILANAPEVTYQIPGEKSKRVEKNGIYAALQSIMDRLTAIENKLSTTDTPTGEGK